MFHFWEARYATFEELFHTQYGPKILKLCLVFAEVFLFSKIYRLAAIVFVLLVK